MTNILLAALLCLPVSAQDGIRYPAKPGPREFILDEAKLLKEDDAAAIRALCDEALTQKKAPIIVVTIPSLATYGAGGWPIERYAMNLMGEWGVGWEDWNYGILLLVSPGDRKARIELGGSWAHRKDEEARRVMSQRIIPQFKQGNYSKGILEGVKGLHELALGGVPSRTQPPSAGMPVPPPSTGSPSSGGSGCLPSMGCGLIALIVVGVVVVLAVSRMSRGGVSSWGPGGGYYGGGYYGGGGGFGSSFGGSLLGSALGNMLYDSYSHRHHDSSGPFFGGGSSSPPSSSSSDSSFGGGSFGGGFSGGGGATGEW